MGFFDSFTADLAARKAYTCHVQGNRLSDEGKPDQAREKHEEAIRQYEKAFAAGNAKASYLMAYGVLLLRFNRYEDAKAAFLKAEKQNLTQAERSQLRVNFAICQWKLGNLDSAIEQLKIAKDTNPTGVVYGSLGYMLVEKGRQSGDFTEAIAFNREAMEYDDEDAVILDNMGQLHLAMGEKDEALTYFTRAHEIRPKQVDTLYYLATLALEKGEKDKAREYLESALEGNYSSLATTTKAQAQALLDSIGDEK